MLAWALSAQAQRMGTYAAHRQHGRALTALYGIAQYFGWDPVLPAAAYHVGEGVWTIVRPPSTLGYVSYFATWLLFVIFLSLAMPGRPAKVCAALALVAMRAHGHARRAARAGGGRGGVGVSGAAFGRAARMGLGRAVAPVVGAGGALRFADGTTAARAAPAGSRRTRGAGRGRCSGATACAWGWRVRSPGSDRRRSPRRSRTTNPRHWRARIPDFAHESPHNIFLDALVGQGIAGIALLAAWCVLGFAAAWKSASLTSRDGGGPGRQRWRPAS